MTDILSVLALTTSVFTFLFSVLYVFVDTGKRFFSYMLSSEE